jgi:hypothetical protein
VIDRDPKSALIPPEQIQSGAFTPAAGEFESPEILFVLNPNNNA